MHLIHIARRNTHMLLAISLRGPCVNNSSLRRLYVNPEVTKTFSILLGTILATCCVKAIRKGYFV